MAYTESTGLDARERDELIGNGGIGVIGFSTAADHPPHSIPVSYGYDAVEGIFYFRLASGPDSAKGNLDGRGASFVTYGTVDERWWSVVATGRLADVDREEIATESLEGLDRVRIPLVDVFDAPLTEVSFEFVRLAPESLTARVESTTNS